MCWGSRKKEIPRSRIEKLAMRVGTVKLSARPLDTGLPAIRGYFALYHDSQATFRKETAN